jgi:putative tryptophan/tyrosine transport system substrate-binding protein
MRRRAFVTSLGATLGTTAAGWPLAARAQAKKKAYRIGILGNSATAQSSGPQPAAPTVNALIQGLRDLGYVYGQHYVTEVRGSDGKIDRFPALVAELIAAKVDVIVSTGNAMPAVKQATSSIPVVMSAHADPVGAGLAASLAKPGGNMTGLSVQAVDLSGKRLGLLKELVPAASSIAMFWDSESQSARRSAETAARERGWKLELLEIADASQVAVVFAAARAAGAGAGLMLASGSIFSHAQHVVEMASQSRMPVLYEFRTYPEAGGLASYGTNIVGIWRRAATYVDKILNGANPAELPIEQPTKFELVLNLKTAKALGLIVPPTLLAIADEVIE